MVVVTRMWRKSTRRLYERERETKDTKHTESDRERTSNDRLKTRARKSRRRRASSPPFNTKNTHLPFGPFFKVVVVVPQKGRKKGKTRQKKKRGTKKHSKKRRERGEKI